MRQQLPERGALEETLIAKDLKMNEEKERMQEIQRVTLLYTQA